MTKILKKVRYEYKKRWINRSLFFNNKKPSKLEQLSWLEGWDCCQENILIHMRIYQKAKLDKVTIKKDNMIRSLQIKIDYLEDIIRKDSRQCKKIVDQLNEIKEDGKTDNKI